MVSSVSKSFELIGKTRQDTVTLPLLQLGFSYLLEWLPQLRETLAYIYGFILKDMIKDTEEEPDTKVQSDTVCPCCFSAGSPLALMGLQQSWGKSKTFLLSPLGN